MDRNKTNVLFALFCLFTVSFGVIEGFLIYKLVDGNFDWSEPLAALLNTGLLAGSGSIFLKLIKGNFVDRKSLPMEKLHAFLSNRRKILASARGTGKDEISARKNLITNTLAFGESVLNGWLPGSHFEFSVFVDREFPIMFCYFDSKHEITSRSMSKRMQNPRFYIENDYEVCKVLRDPSSEPRIISDTHVSDYAFISDQQKKQIRSTALMTIEMETPSVLVTSCNAKNAFDPENKELIAFLRVLAEQIRMDLAEGDLLGTLRASDTGWFPKMVEDQSARVGEGVFSNLKKDEITK